MALLQIRSTLASPRLASLVTLLFNRLTRSILFKFNRQPVYVIIMRENLLYSQKDKAKQAKI